MRGARAPAELARFRDPWMLLGDYDGKCSAWCAKEILLEFASGWAGVRFRPIPCHPTLRGPALTQSASRMMLNLPALPDSGSGSCGGCGLKSSITTSASTEPAPHRCSRDFIVNASKRTPRTTTTGWCIGRARSSTKASSQAMRMRLSTSNIRRRPGSPGGSTTIFRHF